jgi:hypothetical protein
VKYFSDKQYGGPKQSLASAEAALKELKTILSKARLVNGTLSETTVKKGLKAIKN